MTKRDWTLLLIKILGLYLVAMHLGAFITTLSTLIIVVSQAPGGNWQAMPTVTWQAPLSTGLVIAFGLFLTFKSDHVAEMITKK